jgi:DNA-binding phage protein
MLEYEKLKNDLDIIKEDLYNKKKDIQNNKKILENKKMNFLNTMMEYKDIYFLTKKEFSEFMRLYNNNEMLKPKTVWADILNMKKEVVKEEKEMEDIARENLLVSKQLYKKTYILYKTKEQELKTLKLNIKLYNK